MAELDSDRNQNSEKGTQELFVDFLTDNLMTKATKRFSFGWSNFRGIYGSQP